MYSPLDPTPILNLGRCITCCCKINLFVNARVLIYDLCSSAWPWIQATYIRGCPRSLSNGRGFLDGDSRSFHQVSTKKRRERTRRFQLVVTFWRGCGRLVGHFPSACPPLLTNFWRGWRRSAQGSTDITEAAAAAQQQQQQHTCAMDDALFTLLH